MTTIPKGYRVPEQPLLDAWHVEGIRLRIKEVLRLRGITVPFTLTLLENERGDQRLELDSEPFNTWPVIHSELHLETFGTYVRTGTQELKEGGTIPCVRFHVGVHVRYEGNGVGLFNTSGQMQRYNFGRDVLFFDDERHEGLHDQMRKHDVTGEDR